MIFFTNFNGDNSVNHLLQKNSKKFSPEKYEIKRSV